MKHQALFGWLRAGRLLQNTRHAPPVGEEMNYGENQNREGKRVKLSHKCKPVRNTAPVSWMMTSVSHWREAPDPTRAACLWCGASKSQDWHRTIQTVTKAWLTSGLQCSGTFPRNPQREEQHCGSQCRLCTFCRKVSFSLSWNGLIFAAGVSASLVNKWGVIWLKEWVPCVRLGVVDRTGRQNEWEGERNSHRERRLLSRAGQENLLCVCDGWVRTCARKKLAASSYHPQDSIHLHNVFSMRSHVFAYRGFCFIGCQKGKVSCMACRKLLFLDCF